MQVESNALLYQMWSGLGWSKKLAVRFTTAGMVWFLVMAR